jgi:hypothetical protein
MPRYIIRSQETVHVYSSKQLPRIHRLNVIQKPVEPMAFLKKVREALDAKGAEKPVKVSP